MATQALMGQSGPSFDGKLIYPTPSYIDTIVVEVLSRKLENYAALVYGTPHPDTTGFPNHKLVLQVPQSEELVVRYYAADRANQDVYNYSISYADESNAHPRYSRDYIILRTAYAVIAKLTADPVYPTALLVKEDMVEGTGDERIDSLYVRVRRIYEVLPGPTLTDVKINPETRAEVTISKTRKATGTITTGVEVITIGMDDYNQVTSRETIDANTSYEVVTLQPLPDAHSFATAIQETEYSPFQFPATLDVDLYTDTQGIIGYTEPFTRRVKHQKFTWWECSLTEPAIETLMEDLTADGGIPKLGYIFAAFRNGGSVNFNTLSEIIYNPVTLSYGLFSIDWAGSDPDFDTYLSDWTQDASDPRNVIGRVSAGNYFMWKIEILQVKFLMEIGGTVVP